MNLHRMCKTSKDCNLGNRNREIRMCSSKSLQLSALTMYECGSSIPNALPPWPLASE